MSGGIKGVIALGSLIVLAVVIYPNVRASMERSRATARVAEAESLQATLTSPVAKSRLETAATSLRLALGGTAAAGSVADADAALAATIASLKSSPPSDHPVTGELSFDATAHAGQIFPVTVTVGTELAEAYLVRVIVQVDSDAGWTSGPIAKSIEQPLSRPPLPPSRVEIAVPKDAAGRANVQATIVYRLSATGEGRQYQEIVRGKTPVVIGK